MLASLKSIHLTLGGKPLLTDASAQIHAGERVGLIGPNGSGKTTLLRLLTRQIEPDGGELVIPKGVRIGYLPQELAPLGDEALLKFVMRHAPGKETLDARLADIHLQLQRLDGADDPQNPEHHDRLMAASSELADVQSHLDHFSTEFAEHIALRILDGLGFSGAEADRSVSELSGGWQMRARLAALLFSRPEMLLLDEPTNHLDLPTVAWFSEFLRHFAGGLILISHDREFLNGQINRVISLEPEGLRTYVGNYEQYLVAREEEKLVLQNRQKNLAREREKAEEFVERFRASATKAKAVQSRVKALAKLDTVETLAQAQTVRFRFPHCVPSSKNVLAAENLGKDYGERNVFSKVTLAANRGEKIAITGVNGAGKTTLLRLLGGELAATEGTVEWGHNVKIGYFAQHHATQLSEHSTVFETVSAAAPHETNTQVRTLLGSLLFSGDTVEKPIRVLSGGERARVALAKLLIVPANVLLLDEPTNHLDLASSEHLAEALATFEGTLIMVSHNLSFVRKLATTIWNMQNHELETYPGNLDEYLASTVRRFALFSAGEKSAPANSPPTGRNRNEEKERKQREAKERSNRKTVLEPFVRAVLDLEEKIAHLETVQKDREQKMAQPGFFDQSDSKEISRLYHHDGQELDRLTTAWAIASEQLQEKEKTLQ